ncbi:MAG: isopeptide-forming domain-containing fimbrial protein [Clostridiales bacterium]|nr:isopeptide-forming domain-containing fimbrial protein [Clostridiales bacterium]
MKQKGLRRLVSIILAAVMAFSVSAMAFAAGETTIITMSDTTSSYTAYQLMTVTVSDSDNDGTPDKYAYTVNSAYIDAIVAGLKAVDPDTTITNSSTNAEIVAAIAALTDDEARTFADAVYAYITDTSNNLTLTADIDYYTATSGVFTVSYGYYLIAETAAGASGTYSLVMLDTADKSSINVTNKNDEVTMTKKVQDVNDSEANSTTDWQDTADYDIGDSVPFQLTGRVDSYISSYTTYYYAFHDVMSDGLTFDYPTDNSTLTVTITTTESNVTTTYTVDSSCYTVNTSTTDGCTFEVIINDLKTCTESGSVIPVNSTTTVTVNFSATLNDNADMGNNGNPNTARLEYSNNAYNDTNKTYTAWDTVVVYTYQVIINKVDTNSAALAGAGFTLYKKVAITAFDSSETYYIVGTDGELEEVDQDTTQYSSSIDYYICKGTATATGSGNNVFTWTGLDDGDYILVESTVPDGYNKIDDMYFRISADHEPSSGVTPVAGDSLSSISAYLTTLTGTDLQTGAAISFSTATGEGSLTADVQNSTGTELPSTGGMGTAIFHIIGSVLTLGAVVLLVTRVRMRKSE